MKFKKLFITLTILLLFVVPATAFAEASPTIKEKSSKGTCRFGIDTSKLTVAQKADFKETYSKIADNKRDLINKLVAANLITKVQGDSQLKRIEEQVANGNVRFVLGKGFMQVSKFGLDASILTKEQKSYFIDFNKKALELQKELVNKAMSNGLLTKDKADKMLQRIQNLPTDPGSLEKNFSKGIRGKGMRGRDFH